MVKIVLYGKPGCHLCEDARDVVVSVQENFDFEFVEINILDDEALFDKYVVDIPVITIDDEFFCEYLVHREALEDKLGTLTERRKL